MGVNHYLTHYASATQYARIYKERDRVITVKKTIYTYLKNIFDSRLYQFIAFTFYLEPSHKIFFITFTVGLKQNVKILWEEI